jgi:hypothetical protein
MELTLSLERIVSRLRGLNVAWRGTLLALLAFVLLSVIFTNLTWVATTWTAVLARMAVTLLLVALVAFTLPHSQGSRLGLAGAIFAIVYGTMYLLPATETTYVSWVLPLSLAISMVFSGAIITLVFSLAASTLFSPSTTGAAPSSALRLRMGRTEWVEKLLVLAVLWTFLFILVGSLVYTPIAKALDPAGYAAESASVTNSSLALLSQPLWGIAWAMLAVPLIRSLKLGWRWTALALGCFLGALMGADMILATGMSFGLQLGHFAESVTESFAFGALAVWVLQRHGRLYTPADQAATEPLRGRRRAAVH